MAQIAVMGLGIMGGGVAGNLLRAGHNVRVYNRTRAKAEPLIEQGAVWAATPAEAAGQVEAIFSVVGDDAASRAIWTGPTGALAGLAPGTLAVECSTLSLPWASELRGLVQAAGAELVDAPLAGSKNAARSGALTTFVGAMPETFARLNPLLATFASSIIHMGGPGAGSAIKLINNMVGGTLLAVVGEALALAEQLGLNVDLAGQVLMTGPAATSIVKMKMPSMLNHSYEDQHFALRWMAKDLRYALLAARAARLTLPVAVAASQLYEDATDAGHGELDFAAIAEAPRRSD
jgi:3-hydroxyisobutyrate dehydrogenase